MAAKRLSIVTPYRLNKQEQEAFLAEVRANPSLMEKVAGMLDIPVEKWKKRPVQKQLADLAAYEQAAAARATFAKAMEAHRKFNEEAEIAVSGVTSSDVVAELRREVRELKQTVTEVDSIVRMEKEDEEATR